MIKLNYEIIDVKQEEKEKLYKLLQYALYDVDLCQVLGHIFLHNLNH